MPSDGTSPRARTVAVCRPGAALKRAVQVTVLIPRIQKPWPRGQRSACGGTEGSVRVTRWRSAPERLASRYRLITGWPTRMPTRSACRGDFLLTVTDRTSAPRPTPSAAACGGREAGGQPLAWATRRSAPAERRSVRVRVVRLTAIQGAPSGPRVCPDCGQRPSAAGGGKAGGPAIALSVRECTVMADQDKDLDGD
ncbi:hypothetical protein AMK26_22505 [Streptomyces sp. CB03234]|nr:hypothetical protein AMK26_22505 [Streptomyces sp. CB03234]